MYRLFGINWLLIAGTTSGTSETDNWSKLINTLGQFFFAVIIFVAVLFLAYMAAKWLGGSRSLRKGNIEIIDSISLGYQNSVTIIKAGGKYYLIGVTKERISFLTELQNEDDIIVRTQQKGFQGVIDFKDYFNKFIKKSKDSEGSGEEQGEENET